MKILNLLIEAKKPFKSEIVTVYHGDDYGLDHINGNYNLMNQKTSNLQEGVGIYFAIDKEVTKAYGKHVVATQVDKSKFLPSRDNLSKYATATQLAKVIWDCFTANEEEMYYHISNYVMVMEPSDVTKQDCYTVASSMIDGEVRNVQIELIEQCGDNEVFVKSWLKHIKYYGTYNEELGFFAIMFNDHNIEKIS